MMSFTELERQALGSIEHGLAGSDPRLASMLNIFSRLAAGEEMPAGEKIRVRRGRPAALRPRRARRLPRRGRALPQARQVYQRLGWQQTMLLLWVGVSAGLLAVALVLNNSGHTACIRSMGTGSPLPRRTAAAVAPSAKGSPRSLAATAFTKGITVEWKDPS
jgi:hypothetical protein